MATPPGSPKTGGRVAGTPNKRTQTLIEKADELGVDPFEILLRFAKGDWAGLGYDSGTRIQYSKDGHSSEVNVIDPELRQRSAADACQYLYPKRKAIEVKSQEGGPLESLLMLTSEERQARLAEIEKRKLPKAEKPQ